MNLNQQLKDIPQETLQSMAMKYAREIDEQEQYKLGYPLCPKGWVEIFDFSFKLTGIIPYLSFHLESFRDLTRFLHDIRLTIHLGDLLICKTYQRLTDESLLFSKCDVVEYTIKSLLIKNLRNIKTNQETRRIIDAYVAKEVSDFNSCDSNCDTQLCYCDKSINGNGL